MVKSRLILVTSLLIALLAGIHSFSFSGSSTSRKKSLAQRPFSILFAARDFVRVPIDLSLADSFTVNDFVEKYDEDSNIQGVYAISDVDGVVKYVGTSLAVGASVRKLLKRHGDEIVSSVRIQTFRDPKPEALEAYKLELIRITSPTGNLEEASAWDDQDVVRAVDLQPATEVPPALTPDESSSLAAASNKRKSLEDKLAAAVNEVGMVKSSLQTIESPFEEKTRGDEAMVIRPITAKGLDFTVENIEKVLDEVRPYLIADGGNVAVVSIDETTRGIQLALQGACGTCPSSTTTMKMGIERVLKENFAYLGPIVAVEPTTAAVAAKSNSVDTAAVEGVLEKILPAVKGMGGFAELAEIEANSGVVKMRFKGPARLKKGVELALKDVQFVTAVLFEDI